MLRIDVVMPHRAGHVTREYMQRVVELFKLYMDRVKLMPNSLFISRRDWFMLMADGARFTRTPAGNDKLVFQVTDDDEKYMREVAVFHMSSLRSGAPMLACAMVTDAVEPPTFSLN